MSGGETDISPKMSGGETGLQERGRYEDFNGEDQTLDDLEKGKYGNTEERPVCKSTLQKSSMVTLQKGQYAKVHCRKSSMLKYTAVRRL